MLNSKTVSKRLENAKEYIDAHQDKYSKLCIVRVDLGYKKPHSDSIVLNDANNDFNRLLNNRRGKPSVFKDQVGYMCLKEYTEDKGVHLHTIFLYNGNKVQKDAHMGDKIGNYWEELTQGKGSYHNCNRNKYKRNGTGILEHTDKEKRKIFDEDVLSYLCKDDEKQDLAPVKSNKNDRAFVRGTMPKKKDKKGRPRKKSE
jgi:hypothetical protein